MFEQRERLKPLIDGVGYSGNTDIGLGLCYAQSLSGKQLSRTVIKGLPIIVGSPFLIR